MCVAIPGWVLGTLAGAISGNLLPDFMMSALSVAIYGMFLAIIIPPAKQNKAVLAVVVAAMLISTLFKVIPFLSEVSSRFCDHYYYTDRGEGCRILLSDRG